MAQWPSNSTRPVKEALVQWVDYIFRATSQSVTLQCYVPTILSKFYALYSNKNIQAEYNCDIGPLVTLKISLIL